MEEISWAFPMEIITQFGPTPFMGIELLEDENGDLIGPGKDFENALKNFDKKIVFTLGDGTITLPKTRKSIKAYIDYINEIVKIIEKFGYNWWMGSWLFNGPKAGQKGIIHANPKEGLIVVVHDNGNSEKLLREKYYVGLLRKLL